MTSVLQENNGEALVRNVVIRIFFGEMSYHRDRHNRKK